MSEFDAFWSRYPRKESRNAAEREYVYARRRVSADVIMAGLDRYLEHLPRERQYIKKPENWLIDGDYYNEYDEPAPVRQEWNCSHTPTCNNRHWCEVVTWKQRQGA